MPNSRAFEAIPCVPLLRGPTERPGHSVGSMVKLEGQLSGAVTSSCCHAADTRPFQWQEPAHRVSRVKEVDLRMLSEGLELPIHGLICGLSDPCLIHRLMWSGLYKSHVPRPS